MLELKDVTRQYGTHLAVERVSIRVHPGDFLGLIGPNGAGKTTTLRMVTGHLRPSSGQILLDGVDLATTPLVARQKIGYVPELVSLYEYLTGLELLELVAGLKGLSSADARQEIEGLLEVLDLGSERDRLIRTYSQGMRRKVALAMAMVGRPPLLVLDEAMNGLDPSTSHRLKSYLKELTAQGTAIVLSSHILEVLERVCSRVAVMVGGRLVDERRGEELDAIRRADGGLEQYFIQMLERPPRTEL